MGKLTFVLLAALLTFGVTGKALAEEYISGDINHDRVVNITDLSMLLSTYGKTATQCTSRPEFVCDLNSDGVVNVTDLSILLSNYGTKY